ncbi:MAG: InlB B-repeat-containing protein, partial [Bacteroidales bacterium]|nr:InlB B-repeat-containing protein [Bacteroidales bacterium]
MKNTFTKILLCTFALLATSAVFGAPSDVISSVTCASGTTTFTITRSTTTYPTRVYYRTCDGSAVGGVHYAEEAGYIDFAAGEASKTITITKYNVATTSVYAYGESAYRYFRLEVWNDCTPSKFCTCTLDGNTIVSKATIYDAEVCTDEYRKTITSSSRTAVVSVTLSSLTDQFSETRKAYLSAVKTVASWTEYKYMARAEFDLWDYMSATSSSCAFRMMIHNQSNYITYSTSGDGRLAAEFTHVNPKVTNGRGKYKFPVANVNNNTTMPITNPSYWNHGVNDILTFHHYGYEPNAYNVNSTQYIELYNPQNVSVQIQASDDINANSKYSFDARLYLCLKDNKGAALLETKVNNNKIYASGDRVWIALTFDRIVKVNKSSFTIPINIDGVDQDFTYGGGSGTNTLYFYGNPTITSTSVTTATPSWVANNTAQLFGDWFKNGCYYWGTEFTLKIGQKYTVTLNANNGTINCNEINSYTYGVGATLPTNVTRTGYTFDGWYDNSSFTGSKVTTISTTATGNKTYYAKWTANKYLVTFDNQSATSPGTASIYATYGSTMPTIVAPTRKGYTFGGYFSSTNGNGTQYYYASGSGYRTCYLTSPITLYAKWTVKKPTITLDNQGATTAGTETVEATYGADLQTITVPTKTGYTFGGYYTGTNGSGTQYYFDDGTGVMKSDFEVATTLYAKWTVNSYAVTLNQQSATTDGTKSVNVNYGSAMPSITLPKRTGYTFGGFYTSTGGSGTQYYTANGASARSYLLTSNTTLYAKWTKDTYTITYVNNNGTITGTPTTSYQFGNTVTLPADVTRDGCTFGGWYNNANCEGDQIYTIASDEVGNKTFYAKLTPN